MDSISGVYSDSSIFVASAPCSSPSLFLFNLFFFSFLFFQLSLVFLVFLIFSSSSSSFSYSSKLCCRSRSQWIGQFLGLDISGLIILIWQLYVGHNSRKELRKISKGAGICIIRLGRQESGNTLVEGWVSSSNITVEHHEI